MAVQRASSPRFDDSQPEHTRVRPRQQPVLPASLPKEQRPLFFDSADRSSVRRLSQVAPMPTPELGDDIDATDDEIDTLSFRRDELEEAVTRSEPFPRFAPPLPIPPREAIEHPTGTSPRAVLPAPIDVRRPHTLAVPTLPTERRFPWGGVAVLALAAAIGAAVGWWATPHVYGTDTAANE